MSNITVILSASNVNGYHSTRFGGVHGTTIAMGTYQGKVVAFWALQGSPLDQTVITCQSTADLANVVKAFKLSTGLTIADKSFVKLAAPHIPALSAPAVKAVK